MSNPYAKEIYKPKKVKSLKEEQEASSMVIEYRNESDDVVATQTITPTTVFDKSWAKLAEAIAWPKKYTFKLI